MAAAASGNTDSDILVSMYETKSNGIMEQRHLTTNDLSLTAYLVMRGCRLVSAQQLGRSYKFVVNIGDFTEQRLQADYINSESRKFDAAVRDLKKIMFSGG